MPESTQLIAKPKAAIAYSGLVVLPLVFLLLILWLGRGLPSPPSLPGPARPAADVDAGGLSTLAVLMAQIGLIIALTRAMGSLVRRAGQPRVVGEILAGILLGPSFLGWIAPGLSSALFPAQGFVALNALSQVGLVMFMFLIGLELDATKLRGRGHVTILISHAGIAVPMAGGAMLAFYLYPRLSDPTVRFAHFSLFMGISMSVTAFPVLARILNERRLLRTPVGDTAIACAAVDDVTGWCILAYVVGLVHAAHVPAPILNPILKMVGGLLGFLLLLFGPVRSLLRRTERAYIIRRELSDNRKALVLLVLLGSALATELLGLHLLFGAFVAGAVMPKKRDFVSYVNRSFASLTLLLLLPLFFAYTGLRTRIGQIRGAGMWWLVAAIVAVAVIGKLGGASIAARAAGMKWRDSLAIGALMNTRGMMELIVLNIGLDIKVLSPTLFSMLVVMAIVTTMMTAPLLHSFYKASKMEGPDG